MELQNEILTSVNKVTLTTPDKATSPLDDPEEQAHIRSVAAGFFFY
jgi:hypothetical protein